MNPFLTDIPPSSWVRQLQGTTNLWVNFAAFTSDVVCNVVFLPTSIVYCFLASFTLKVMLLKRVLSVEILSLCLDGPIFSYMFLFLIYNSGRFYSILPFRIFLSVLLHWTSFITIDRRKIFDTDVFHFFSFLFLFKRDNCKLAIPKCKKKKKRNSDILNLKMFAIWRITFSFYMQNIYQSDDFIRSTLNKLLRHFKYKYTSHSRHDVHRDGNW